MLTPLDGIENRLHLGHARLRILFDESEDDIVLVLEQSINLADADRCLSGEFGSGRRMESFGIEQFACGLDYPLSWRFRSNWIDHETLSPLLTLFSMLTCCNNFIWNERSLHNWDRFDCRH